jgi:hypothetical protein
LAFFQQISQWRIKDLNKNTLHNYFRRVRKMRKISYIAALLLLSLVGCMQESNITDPGIAVLKSQQKTIISLPAKADLNVEAVFSTSQDISGTTGGELHLTKSYQAENGQTVNIDCRLTVPANDLSFNNTRNITMQVGSEAGVDFYPSMSFSQPVILNYTITGVDLNGVNPDDVEFYYVDNSGNLLPTQNDGVIVNTATGTLQVLNAQLPHFSRWAYAR